MDEGSAAAIFDHDTDRTIEVESFCSIQIPAGEEHEIPRCFEARGDQNRFGDDAPVLGGNESDPGRDILPADPNHHRRTKASLVWLLRQTGV